jgi:two-component system response regulator GlrR
MSQRLLIVEDKPSALEGCVNDLRSAAPSLIYERVEWSATVPQHIREWNPELILVVPLPGLPFVNSFFQWIKENQFAKPILAVVPGEASSELVKMASQIFDDFVVAPVRSNELVYRVFRILGKGPDTGTTVDERVMRDLALEGLIGDDPGFRHTVNKIPLAARCRGPVLILGETGTGKGLCARAIHNLGPRINFPFIPIDCASVPDHLFENEVFGHVNGAFTDARRDQKGLLALSNRGTLFLDEIDSLSLSAQSKLLRFLDERTYRPLGSEQFIRLDVNVVAASNSNLEDLVRKKQFRSDLFFRLDVFRLCLSPLRERAGDISLLTHHFLSRLSAENGVKKTIAPAALRKLAIFDWPGNVRQLYNVIQRAFILTEATEILPSHIEDLNDHLDSRSPVGSFRQARLSAIESFEKGYVEEIMRECAGNVSRAARLAKQDRRSIGRLVKRYGINRQRV